MVNRYSGFTFPLLTNHFFPPPGASVALMRAAIPKAKRAYAWTHRDGNQNKTIAVLEIPPVDSPKGAAKIAIASKHGQISIDKKSAP